MQGKHYEHLLGREKRKSLGAYYTPEAVIDFILDNTVAQADLTADPFLRILDPACGCGYFLLRTYDLLYKKFSAQLEVLRERYSAAEYCLLANGKFQTLTGLNYWRQELLPYHIITHCLFGADIDQGAVTIARNSLSEKTGFQCHSPNIIVCDSLARREETCASGHTAGESSQFWSKKYSYVIGNPPYISHGLRGTSPLDKHRYKELMAAFPASAEYKISIYALFFERGIELLKPQGKLAYITPDSFLSGKYFSKLRKLLAAHAIESITLLEFPVFEDAAIGKGVVTVLAKREEQNNQVCVQAAAKADQVRTGEFVQQYRYEQRHLGSNFSLFFNHEELEVYYAMQAFDQHLSGSCGVYSGCIARYGQRSIIADNPAESIKIYDYSGKIVLNDDQASGRWRKLIGRGAYIGQYWKKPVEEYIYVHEDETVRRKYGKSGFDLEKYTGDKLFLRQTGEDLIAAYDDQGYFCLNNLHILYPTNQCLPIKVILALLNSRLYNYYYHCVTRETRRVLPQVDIDQIRKLPVIAVADTQQIVAITNELIASYAEAETWRNPGRGSGFVELREHLENLLLENLDVKRETKHKIIRYGKRAAMPIA